ncbi:hypothetical protein HNR02_005107 [Amycolatopsis endophytica]|uniref:Uncharacterized protein n=1 Tax=Amycolatopsis endophytica TaxID=860233 RepID=A0A853BAJ8_9PSEU|nr:hypothetical protein [Amycolatopsis endophytica]
MSSASGSASGVRSMTPPGPTGVSFGRGPRGDGQGSRTTCAPGVLNAVTTRSMRAAGHVASRSMADEPAGHTVAGVGVGATPCERERRVVFAGLPGLGRVVVGAVGQGLRSLVRRRPARVEDGCVESDRLRGVRRPGRSGVVTGIPSEKASASVCAWR